MKKISFYLLLFTLTSCKWEEPSFNTLFDMVLIDGGSFDMGRRANDNILDTQKRDDEVPVHAVTLAEWEFAARGGNKSQGFIFAGSNSLAEVGWYDANSGRSTRPGGQKQANELGLYDMSGNVWEWCSDWYGPYSKEPATNPKGPSAPSQGAVHVHRGGSYMYGSSYCRITYRGGHIFVTTPNVETFTNYTIGFRLAADAK